MVATDLVPLSPNCSGDGDGDGDGGGDGDGDGEIAMSLELQCALKEIQNISKGILNLDKLVH